jgi:hypothetical protein
MNTELERTGEEDAMVSFNVISRSPGRTGKDHEKCKSGYCLLLLSVESRDSRYLVAVRVNYERCIKCQCVVHNVTIRKF